MLENLDAAPGRRALLKNALVLAGALAVPGAVNARQRLTGRDLQPMRQPPLPNHPTMPNPVEVASRPVMASPRVVRPALFREAMAALQKHGSRVHQRDRMAIVDFAVGSSEPRLHLIDLVSGKSQSLLVSHGSGSGSSPIWKARSGWNGWISLGLTVTTNCVVVVAEPAVTRRTVVYDPAVVGVPTMLPLACNCMPSGSPWSTL